MNPLLREAVQHVEYSWMMGALTALFLAGFVYWIWWAWADRNRERWEAASQLPFTDGGES